MKLSELVQKLFNVKVESVLAVDAINESEETPALLAREAGRALMEDDGDKPLYVCESSDGFAIIGQRNAIWLGTDGTIETKGIEAPAEPEGDEGEPLEERKRKRMKMAQRQAMLRSRRMLTPQEKQRNKARRKYYKRNRLHIAKLRKRVTASDDKQFFVVEAGNKFLNYLTDEQVAKVEVHEEGWLIPADLLEAGMIEGVLDELEAYRDPRMMSALSPKARAATQRALAQKDRMAAARKVAPAYKVGAKKLAAKRIAAARPTTTEGWEELVADVVGEVLEAGLDEVTLNKKHFDEFASAISGLEMPLAKKREVASAIAGVLSNYNPAFKADMFVRAAIKTQTGEEEEPETEESVNEDVVVGFSKDSARDFLRFINRAKLEEAPSIACRGDQMYAAIPRSVAEAMSAFFEADYSLLEGTKEEYLAEIIAESLEQDVARSAVLDKLCEQPWVTRKIAENALKNLAEEVKFENGKLVVTGTTLDEVKTTAKKKGRKPGRIAKQAIGKMPKLAKKTGEPKKPNDVGPGSMDTGKPEIQTTEQVRAMLVNYLGEQVLDKLVEAQVAALKDESPDGLKALGKLLKGKTDEECRALLRMTLGESAEKPAEEDLDEAKGVPCTCDECDYEADCKPGITCPECEEGTMVPDDGGDDEEGEDDEEDMEEGLARDRREAELDRRAAANRMAIDRERARRRMFGTAGPASSGSLRHGISGESVEEGQGEDHSCHNCSFMGTNTSGECQNSVAVAEKHGAESLEQWRTDSLVKNTCAYYKQISTQEDAEGVRPFAEGESVDEMALTAKTRAGLKDSDFAYVDEDGKGHYPIHDKAHVLAAIAYAKKYKNESAKQAWPKIVAAAKKHGIDAGTLGETVIDERGSQDECENWIRDIVQKHTKDDTGISTADLVKNGRIKFDKKTVEAAVKALADEDYMEARKGKWFWTDAMAEDDADDILACIELALNDEGDEIASIEHDLDEAKKATGGRWVTTKKGHKLHFNAKGIPDKGNPKVIAAASAKMKAKGTGSFKAAKAKVKEAAEGDRPFA